MFVIGLTGGIGSGKSTVANLFSHRNIPIIDADAIARQLTERGEQAYEKITQHFPNTIVQANGDLDRKRLRELIFSDPIEKAWLEHLLHPLIRDEMERQVKLLFAPYCVVVIPLLFESEPFEFINRTLVVDTEPSLQLQRVKARDESDLSVVEAIMKTQLEREARNSRADDVIYNDGSLADLEVQVDKLHEKYLQLEKGN